MQKLLYLGIFLFDNKLETGVVNKMKGQVRAFKKRGFDVYYTSIYNDSMFIESNTDHVRIAKNPKDPYAIRYFLYKGVKKWLKNNPMDICYIRYAFCDPIFLCLIRYMKYRGIKIIIEVPTYPYGEEMNCWPFLRRYAGKAVEYILNKRLKKYISLVTTYTSSELIFGVKTVKIENGVDVEKIKPWRHSPKDSDIHIIAVSSMHSWHGYDRAIKGMAGYYSRPVKTKVFLHLVGDGVMRREWEKLSQKLIVDKYVIFHGPLVNEELDLLFDKCDIALGCLGIYRKKLTQPSTLKNKEYCARGIPFAFACEEKYLHPGLEFVKILPDNDELINMDELIEFCNSMKALNNISHAMRDYANKHFLWDTQIERIFTALSGSLIPVNKPGER